MSLKIDALAYVKKGETENAIQVFKPAKYVKEARKIAYGLLKNDKVKNNIIEWKGTRSEVMIVTFCWMDTNGRPIPLAEMTRQGDSYMFREYSLTGIYLNVYRAFPDGSVKKYDHAKEQAQARKRAEARWKKEQAQDAKMRY